MAAIGEQDARPLVDVERADPVRLVRHLVAREGSTRAVGKRIAALTGAAPDSGGRALERAKRRIRDGGRPASTFMACLRRVAESGSPEDEAARAARLPTYARRAAAGEDLFRGGPAKPRRPLLELAQELGFDEQLRAQAVVTDLRQAHADALEADRVRRGLERDDPEDLDEELVDGGAA